MSSRLRTFALPSVAQVESGALEVLGGTLAEAGFDLDRVVVVTGTGPSSEHGVRVHAKLQAHAGERSIFPVSAGSFSEANRLTNHLAEWGGTTVIAVGGGRTIDVAKKGGSLAGVDVVAVPTALANDGMASPIVSLVDDLGKRHSIGGCMASAVVVDVDVVGSAPLSMLRAGLGDLVSNITAALDWRLAARDFGEAFDAVAAATAEGAAAAVLDMGSLRDPQAVKALAEGLLMSGLAMAVAGTSRPCSGSEHLVSHALDHILGQDARLHGEQVALGTLVALAAHGVDDTPVRRLFQRCGVPVHPAEIGLRSEDLAKAVSLGPSLRPDRRTILDNFADDNERTAQLVNAVFFRLAVAA